jgi:hypothetical protein
MDELPQWHDLTQEYSTKSTRSELGRWRFSLYSRAIHPDLIVSVNQIELIADTIGMQMSIVEDGHVVEYLLENHRITQVLMPETALLPESGLLARARVIGHRQLDQQFFPDLHLYSSVQSDTVDAEVYDVLSKEIEREAKRAVTIFRFPRQNYIRMSMAHVEAFADSILVQWVHMIPQELTILRTQTLIEWTNK